MIIKKSTTNSILPEAVDALQSVKGIATYHSEYKYRPPLGLYNMALQKVFSDFREILTALDELLKEEPYRDREKYGERFDKNLLKKQESLLKSIAELFDANMNVLK
jgi:Rad3-related DNA helicase